MSIFRWNLWARQYRQSIKAIEAEDKIDLYFYRPSGFVFAKAGHILGLSPTHLSLFGLALGLVSGIFFYFSQVGLSLALGALFLIASGILDSADGQLARLAGRSTPFGLVLDGICDNLVFAAAYIGCTLTLMPLYGWKIWLVAVAAGACHSLQSATLDFYNREYLYFGCGLTKGDYWNPSLEEARGCLAAESSRLGHWASRLRYTWLWQQHLMSGRSNESRSQFRRIVLGDESESFCRLYAKHNHWNLHLWRPLGANVHTIMIIAFAAIRRFDGYLILIDIVGLTAWLLVARQCQMVSDRRTEEDAISSGLFRAFPDQAQ